MDDVGYEMMAGGDVWLTIGVCGCGWLS